MFSSNATVIAICLAGSMLDVGLALGITFSFGIPGWTVSQGCFRLGQIVAYGLAAVIGFMFGILPAIIAAQLDPVDALSREQRAS